MGNTSSEQYNNYLNQLTNKDYIISIYNEYPYLFNKLILSAKEKTSDLSLFYSRLSNDYYSLCQRYGNIGVFSGFYHVKTDADNIISNNKICQFDNVSLLFSQKTEDTAISSNKLLLEDTSYNWEKYTEDDTC